MLTPYQAGSTIVSVPLTALRTAKTVPKRISDPIGPITVHGLLAADLAMDESNHLWKAVLPSPQDFQESMPLMWDPQLQDLLPEAARTLLENQKRKLSRDWAAVSKAFPLLTYDEYLYTWLITNTRTFYFLSPSRKAKHPSNRDDCMALNPFADYFNHTDDQGCEVTFGPNGYAITTDKPIKKGEEIYISYGNHSNDFLLAEYGFILEENKWDEICLDSYILPLLSEIQKKTLKDAGFLGKYVLDKETVCYRTQVALRLLCLPLKDWRRFLNGHDDGKDQSAVDQLLLKILRPYSKTVEETIKSLAVLDCGLASQRETLSRRWRQIHLILRSAIARI
jgi:hypothetical protein